MALTELQRSICRLIAASRVAGGESYVAGGVALNTLIGAPRVSRDIDLFHDTAEAVQATWATDRRLLEAEGYRVAPVREQPAFVEAQVGRDGDVVLVQWARDSAFRFFPLVEHSELGLVLHPFDLATNKVLALVGRLEVRDWIDVIECERRIQPLGYLAWAASGKDPGFSPAAILEQAARTARYSRAEVEALSFDGPPPDAAELSRTWHRMLASATEIVAALPPEAVGQCVLGAGADLFTGPVEALRLALERQEIAFHPGRIKGALPRIVTRTPAP